MTAHRTAVPGQPQRREPEAPAANGAGHVTPSVVQRVAYIYGRRLPATMRRWVAHDLAGKGAVRRHLIRYAIPPLVVLGPLWLLPAPLWVHVEMTAPIYIWALLISSALNKVWRRHRLVVHGLDANLVDLIRQRREAAMRENYVLRYGPRPQSADRQANSSPF